MKKYIIILIFIAIITHLSFFNFWNILFFSDWTNWSNIATKELLNFWWWWWINYFWFWWDNIQYYFNFFKWIWWIIWDYNIATKITFFIPIALLWFLAPFFLTKYYTKNDLISFLVALFYWFNTYFLVRQTAHLPLAFLVWLMLLLFLFFDKFIKNLNKKDFFIFTFLYFIWICYEIRLLYIITLLLLIYFIVFFDKKLITKTLWKYLILFVMIQLFLNSFWIIPTFFYSWESISWTANRWLFWSHLFNIIYAFNIFDSSWSWWLPNQDFIPQNIPFYFWFYPFLVFLSTLFIKKYTKDNQKLFLFWLIISLIWIVITKQSAEPFTWLYLWLYNNFPWFNLFREASKFYIVTLLWYTIILWIFLDYLYKNHKKFFNIIWIIIILISITIAKPLITKEIWTIFIAKIEPKEYKILNDYIINQDESFKTLSAPHYSQWLHFEIKKPKISLIFIIDWEYKHFNVTPIEYRKYNDVSSFIFEPISDKLLDISWIKYVIVWFKDEKNWDNFFRFYWSSPEQYYKKLKEFNFLNEIKLDWLNEVKVFENHWYLSTIFSSNDIISKENIDYLKYNNLNFTQKNPSHYNLNIHLKWKQIINLSQKKNKNWNLIVWNFNWYDYFNKNLFLADKNDISLDFINSWTISKDEIIKYVNNNYSDELKKEWYPKTLANWKLDYKYYTLNPDWSIDVELTLYFKPQSYFYLWLIISATTFVLLLWYLGFDTVRNRRRKENEEK